MLAADEKRLRWGMDRPPRWRRQVTEVFLRDPFRPLSEQVYEMQKREA